MTTIQIWNGTEWVDKFSSPDDEVQDFVALLREGGLNAVAVPNSYPKRISKLEQTIVQTLLERGIQYEE
jgi:hypothetical protein